jgi:hypothetical protein
MKIMKILIILLTLTFRAYSPGNQVVSILLMEPMRPYEAIWNATCKGESNFDPFAIGDKHLKAHSYGIVQVRKSRLDDYYRETGIRHTVTDMFDPKKAKMVFMHYAQGDYENVSRTWNGGPDGMQNPKTYEYWLRIKSYL